MRNRNPFVPSALAAPVFALALAAAGVACSSSPSPAPPQPAAAAAPATRPPDGAAPAAVTPAMLAGNWLFEMKVGGRSVEGSLHFAVAWGVLAGTFTRSDGNEQELKNIEIKGNQVAWDIEGTGGKQHAKGTVDGSSMKGTVKRTGGRGGRGGGGNPDGEAGDPGGSDTPRDGGGTPSGGGGRRGGRGGGGRRGGGGGTSEITFIAYKSVPPVETGAPAPTPTPAS
ncbi:MAG TPA: hypothetical protein VIZ69_05890 [Thermoanaerobaculia bacterium]